MVSPPTLPAAPGVPPACAPSPPISLLGTLPLNGLENMTLCVKLLSLNMTLSWFLHVVACLYFILFYG